MTRFLFWNLNRRELHGFVRNLARQENADVVILAECPTSPAQLLEELNADSSDYADARHYQYAPGNCGHLLFFTRFESSLLTPLFESHRVSIRRLELPGCQSILLAAAHLPAKMNFSEESLLVESVHLAQSIDEVERSEGHQRTILLGDMNMNPFEAGMVIAGGLHAVMSRRVASRKTRLVQKQRYKFFYNPMWNHFGDNGEAGGTFYYEGAEHLCYYWNLFDQVLLRPDLLDGFAPENVRIPTSIRGFSLLQEDGQPDKETMSDHLPVTLELKF
ncbi:MAG: endonuclease/exonuclease/phosphatase family protein [Terriglobales bacterium]